MQFATAFSNTMVFPILPFMVKFLLPEIEIVSIGKSVYKIVHMCSRQFFKQLWYTLVLLFLCHR